MTGVEHASVLQRGLILLPERQLQIEPRVAQRTLGWRFRKVALPERQTQMVVLRIYANHGFTLASRDDVVARLYFPFRESANLGCAARP